MAQESSLFHGEWWQRWSMVSLPPHPQPPDSLKAGSSDLDLERAASLPLPPSDDWDGPEREPFEKYPARLETYSRHKAGFGDLYSEYSGEGGPCLHVYHFRYLRHYDLQRISNRLYYLQTRLRLGYILSNKDGEELNGLLKDQATAARDYQYMTTNLTPCPDIQKIFIPTDVFPEIEIPSKGDLFGKYYELPDAHKESWRLATALSRVFPKSWTYSTHEKALYLMRLPARTFSLPVRIVASTIIALSGGALLIVPMVVMSFNPSRPKSLITVSCAVFLFGFCVGVVLRRKTYNTFLATAAYAAVLVVFVGTGTGSG